MTTMLLKINAHLLNQGALAHMLGTEQTQGGVEVLMWIQSGDKMGEEGQTSVGGDVGCGINKHADYLRDNIFRCCRR